MEPGWLTPEEAQRARDLIASQAASRAPYEMSDDDILLVTRYRCNCDLVTARFYLALRRGEIDSDEVDLSRPKK